MLVFVDHLLLVFIAFVSFVWPLSQKSWKKNVSGPGGVEGVEVLGTRKFLLHHHHHHHHLLLLLV
jgi:hypothetical protein